MAHYRVLREDEQAHKNLEAVCGILNAMCKTDTLYMVGVTYLDYGQDWKWTTILNNKGVQVLNPADWERIENAGTIHELAKITEDIRAGKYFRE